MVTNLVWLPPARLQAIAATSENIVHRERVRHAR